MKIYWLKFNCSEEEYERITPLLSEQRRCYCDDKKSLNAKLCSAFSYAVLRYALKNDYGIETCPVFSFKGHGKPFMENIDLFFNISHSGNIVMCTVTEKETGIDIQHIRPITLRAFQMGFLLFIPFLVIDIVISSTLMAMGMMMLPPSMISLPFKVMLFVLVDGWQLLVGTLVSSFNV